MQYALDYMYVLIWQFRKVKTGYLGYSAKTRLKRANEDVSKTGASHSS
jgi:hypothetical protein